MASGQTPPPGTPVSNTVQRSTTPASPRTPGSMTSRAPFSSSIPNPNGPLLIKQKLGEPVSLTERPGFVGLGREAKVNINCYPITAYPSKIVWQYDVTVGDNIDKRGLIQKVWDSSRVRTALKPGWIFDGNKLAW